jgi:dihydrofolate reductase
MASIVAPDPVERCIHFSVYHGVSHASEEKGCGIMKARSGMRISLIAAMAENRVIGYKGSIPWKIPGEQKLFKRITLGHALIMGRKTYEDIGRPLPDRLNIVISRQTDYRPAGCLKADTLENALALCPMEETEAFIIGGGSLFRESLPIADRIYLTVLPLTAPGDTFFPEIPAEFVLASSEHLAGPYPYTFDIYDRIRNGSCAGESRHV